MSHVVEMKTRFTDMDALRAAGLKRGAEVSVAEAGRTVTRDLYEGQVPGVAAVQLRGWKYPVMVQPDGTCKYDNYNGSWGRQEELDGLAQDYGEEVATSHLTRAGYRLEERKVENGTLELVFVA